MVKKTVGKARELFTALVQKANPKDVSFAMRMLFIGIFLVLIAITYSIIHRGSVDINVDVSGHTAGK